MSDSTNIPLKLHSVIIHATVADPGLWPDINVKGQVRGQVAVQLYYLCRALDVNGSGYADIEIPAAAEILQTSIYAIRRRINWGISHGLFRAKLRRSPGVIRIFYSSLVKVAARLGLDDLGAITEIDISNLRNIKFAATEAEALQLQKSSRWRESHRKKTDRRKTLDPETLTNSSLCRGSMLAKYGRLTILKRSTAAYGGSQKRLGWEQGRHISTIQRRLSDGYREKHGLDPIPKTQLATVPEYFTLHTPSNKPPIRKLKPGQRLIKIPKLGLFRITCNVYSIPDRLKSQRMLRAKVKRAVQRAADDALLSNDWKCQPGYNAMREAWQAATNDNSDLCSEKFAPPRSTKEFK